METGAGEKIDHFVDGSTALENENINLNTSENWIEEKKQLNYE